MISGLCATNPDRGVTARELLNARAMFNRVFRASVVLGLAVVATLTSGCSSPDARTLLGSGSEAESGSVGLALDLASGGALNTIAYTIVGPGGFSRSGTIDTSHSATVSSTIGGLPTGHGFSITLDGTATDGGTHCAGSASFDIAARMTTSVSVHLTCHETARTGSVLVNGTLNVCPTVDGISASPAEVLVGSSLSLSAAAHDSDSAPAALAYHWSTTGGTLSSPDVQNPSLTCTKGGVVTVSVIATDGDCTVTRTSE